MDKVPNKGITYGNNWDALKLALERAELYGVYEEEK